MIQGLSHITFIVKDLDKMDVFLTSIFAAKRIYDSGEQTFSLSKERFYMIGDIWIAVMEGGPLSEKSYNHVAFKISEEDFDLYKQRIIDLGVELKKERPRVEGEGRSLYFYDYDHHLFELHTGTLDNRLKAYKCSE